MSFKYEKESKRHPERFVANPIVAFHGTRLGNVPNIGRARKFVFQGFPLGPFFGAKIEYCTNSGVGGLVRLPLT